MANEHAIQYRLEDDGTLDTVVSVRAMNAAGSVTDSVELRYDIEVAAEYRDANGNLDFGRFCMEVVADDAADELALES